MPYPRFRRTYFYVGFLLLLLIALHYLGWLKPAEYLARSLITPFTSRVHIFSVEVKSNYDFFRGQPDCLKLFEGNKAEQQKISVLDAKVKLLEDENSELRKQIGFKKISQAPSVPAEVVGRNLDSIDKTVIINEGESRGIKVNQPVVAGEGVLIGKIIKTEKDVSSIRLINDGQSKIAAMVLNQERSIGVVEGGHGLSMRLNFIPRNEAVAVGDQVVTSGLEIEIPRGILIGQIAVVENEAYQPFQQAVLTPAIDLSKLITVSVLLTN